MDKIEQHIHDTVKQIDYHAMLKDFGPDANICKMDEEAIIKEFGSMEAFYEFEKAMDEYDDRGLCCRPDMMDDDCDIEGRPL
jgi:predicted enzyme involved in methoxymalonyl-ACP biosynthesis